MLNLLVYIYRKQSVELPPNFQGCSLKGRPFTPSLDLSIHNVQGIDVWAPRGPKPYGKVSTVSRKFHNSFNKFIKYVLIFFKHRFYMAKYEDTLIFDQKVIVNFHKSIETLMPNLAFLERNWLCFTSFH